MRMNTADTVDASHDEIVLPAHAEAPGPSHMQYENPSIVIRSPFEHAVWTTDAGCRHESCRHEGH